MVENGHSWSSIKRYTLSEIGTFYKVIILAERSKKAETLSNIWMGNHLEYDDFNKVINNLGVEVKQQKTAEPSDVEVKADWNKLAGALRGL